MGGKTVIGVVGGQRPSPEALANAEAVGRRVARAGAVLLCGGLGGVMEAACRGAKAEGGLTVGILPGVVKDGANPYVDIPIVTAMGTARNVILVRTADALIAIEGRYGTLSEIAHALDQGKRVVSLGSWDLARVGAEPDRIVQAPTPEDAVRRALGDVTRASEGR